MKRYFLEIKNTLTVTRGEGEGENRGKKGKGQTKEHEYRSYGHGQCGGLTMGVRVGAGKNNGGHGGTTVTEQQ